MAVSDIIDALPSSSGAPPRISSAPSASLSAQAPSDYASNNSSSRGLLSAGGLPTKGSSSKQLLGGSTSGLKSSASAAVLSNSAYGYGRFLVLSEAVLPRLRNSVRVAVGRLVVCMQSTRRAKIQEIHVVVQYICDFGQRLSISCGHDQGTEERQTIRCRQVARPIGLSGCLVVWLSQLRIVLLSGCAATMGLRGGDADVDFEDNDGELCDEDYTLDGIDMMADMMAAKASISSGPSGAGGGGSDSVARALERGTEAEVKRCGVRLRLCPLRNDLLLSFEPFVFLQNDRMVQSLSLRLCCCVVQSLRAELRASQNSMNQAMSAIKQAAVDFRKH